MNERIMRRGLSPEGCRIREKYQGSLLNDEFGVTSKPIHKKIEKYFLKENVMRLKEIQAKCRTQESRPISGNKPVKAIRPSNLDLSFREKNQDSVIVSEEKKLMGNLREGSAHSDYFSLPDDTQNEPDYTRSHSNILTKNVTNFEVGKYCTKVPHIMPVNRLVNNNQGRTLVRRNIKDKTEAPSLKFLISHPVEKQNPNLTVTKSSKVLTVLEKIKNKRPACETNPELIWKDIRKEHRSLFPKDDCFSISMPQTLQIGMQKNIKPFPNSPTKSSTLVRSRSLDRNVINRTRSLNTENCDSTYSLEDRHKSLSTNKLLNVDQNSELFASSTPRLGFKNSNHTDNTKESLENAKHNEESISNKCHDISKDHVTSGPSPTAAKHSNYTYEENEGLSNTDLTLKENNFNNNESQFCEATSIAKKDYKQDSHLSSPCSSVNFDFASTIKEKHDLMNEQIQVEGEPLLLNLPSPSATPCNWESKEEHIGLKKEDLWEKRKGSSIPNLNTVDQIDKEEMPVIAKKTQRIQRNESPLLRSKSSNNLHLAGEPPPSYKRGQLPRYLKIRKAEVQRKLEAAAAVDPLCPPGHSPVPDSERKNTLHLLKKAQIDVLRQLSALPLAQDTIRIRKVKNELEVKLDQIEEGITIFSQQKVYVLNDED